MRGTAIIGSETWPIPCATPPTWMDELARHGPYSRRSHRPAADADSGGLCRLSTTAMSGSGSPALGLTGSRCGCWVSDDPSAPAARGAARFFEAFDEAVASLTMA